MAQFDKVFNCVYVKAWATGEDIRVHYESNQAAAPFIMWLSVSSEDEFDDMSWVIEDEGYDEIMLEAKEAAADCRRQKEDKKYVSTLLPVGSAASSQSQQSVASEFWAVDPDVQLRAQAAIEARREKLLPCEQLHLEVMETIARPDGLEKASDARGCGGCELADFRPETTARLDRMEQASDARGCELADFRAETTARLDRMEQVLLQLQQSQGKDKMKRPSGLSPARSRVTTDPITGEVVAWNGRYRWIRPKIPVEPLTKCRTRTSTSTRMICEARLRPSPWGVAFNSSSSRTFVASELKRSLAHRMRQGSEHRPLGRALWRSYSSPAK